MTTPHPLFNWRKFPRPSIFAMDVHFSGGQQGGVGVKAAIELHNARPQMAANISTEPADRLARPRRKGRALV